LKALLTKVVSTLKLWQFAYFWNKDARVSATRIKRPIGLRLFVEELEQKILPSTWMPFGAATQAAPNSVTGMGPANQVQNVSGRVAAIAVSNNYDGQNHKAVFVGTASGGIWRTTDVNNDGVIADSPTWTPVARKSGCQEPFSDFP
jgi:hypothetical protein